MIRAATVDDAAEICEIYNHYVAFTVITFEETPVSVAEMARRIATVTATFPWLVDERDGSLTGYAYAAPWKDRSAYRYSVESTIYLRPEHIGQGVGRALYAELIAALRPLGLHSVIGGIALPNPASVALHESLGFREIGRFHEVGWKHDKWIDVGYWEMLLDDRGR